jgi:hypothetical protein
MVARAVGDGETDPAGAEDGDAVVDEAGSLADAVEEGLEAVDAVAEPDEVGDDDGPPQPITTVQTKAASSCLVRPPMPC